jgi:hypothetical protein
MACTTEMQGFRFLFKCPRWSDMKDNLSNLFS